MTIPKGDESKLEYCLCHDLEHIKSDDNHGTQWRPLIAERATSFLLSLPSPDEGDENGTVAFTKPVFLVLRCEVGYLLLGGIEIDCNGRNIELYAQPDDKNSLEYQSTHRGSLEEGDWYKSIIINSNKVPCKYIALKLLSLRGKDKTKALIRLLKVKAKLIPISTATPTSLEKQTPTITGPSKNHDSYKVTNINKSSKNDVASTPNNVKNEHQPQQKVQKQTVNNAISTQSAYDDDNLVKAISALNLTIQSMESRLKTEVSQQFTQIQTLFYHESKRRHMWEQNIQSQLQQIQTTQLEQQQQQQKYIDTQEKILQSQKYITENKHIANQVILNNSTPENKPYTNQDVDRPLTQTNEIEQTDTDEDVEKVNEEQIYPVEPQDNQQTSFPENVTKERSCDCDGICDKIIEKELPSKQNHLAKNENETSHQKSLEEMDQPPINNATITDDEVSCAKSDHIVATEDLLYSSKRADSKLSIEEEKKSNKMLQVPTDAPFANEWMRNLSIQLLQTIEEKYDLVPKQKEDQILSSTITENMDDDVDLIQFTSQSNPTNLKNHNNIIWNNATNDLISMDHVQDAVLISFDDDNANTNQKTNHDDVLESPSEVNELLTLVTDSNSKHPPDIS